MVSSSADVQRLFLQAILSRGVMTDTLAKVIYAKCIDAVKASDDTLVIPDLPYIDFVHNVNESIDILDLEFRGITDETSGQLMYALVNRKDDEVSQLATEYSPAEISLYKAIVEQIMLAPKEAYSMSSIAALREVNHLKTHMSKAQAEIVIGSFVAKGWLSKSKRGRYSLSSRAILELQPYLKSTYPDEILECTVCKETLTRGVACSNTNCSTRVHYHCYRKLIARTRPNCPACSTPWPKDPKSRDAAVASLIPVGEEAVPDGREVPRVVRDRDGQDSEGNEEEDEEVDEEEASQPRPTQSKNRVMKSENKGKGKKRAIADSEEEDE